ncbi:MAG: PHP domain-containing protein [Promethearchaeota archaeon]
MPVPGSLPIDRHVHTRWSLDIPHGPDFDDYCVHLEENQVRVGFLDHYEILYDHEERNPLREERFPHYLERIDEVRSNWGDWVQIGLEVDFYPYPDRFAKLEEFVHDQGREFDFLVGSLHEVEDYGPVTIRSDLQRLVSSREGGFDEVVDEYFDLQLAMARSGLFKAIAHPDTIFRFCNDLVPWNPDYGFDPRLEELARECARKGIALEYNLSGDHYPVHRRFPDTSVVPVLAQKTGVKFFVGSDSHSVPRFLSSVQAVKEAHAMLEGLGALVTQ